MSQGSAPLEVGLLSEAQRMAAHWPPDQPEMILAGPGSGKTRVITQRIGYLVREHGMSPSRILAVTFTNAAAVEMTERLLQVLGSRAEQMRVSTFHAICARLLREHGTAIGVPPRYSIYSGRDREEVIKQAWGRFAPIGDEMSMTKLGADISRFKAGMYGDDGSPAPPWLAEMVERYNAQMRRVHALDFDDLLGEALRLFDERPSVLEGFASGIDHVLVDEFQDTNLLQYKIAHLLATSGPGFTVVGDPDQSIYSWRAADVRNIERFMEDFPHAEYVLLDECYRSTQRILGAARAVIGGSQQWFERKLRTRNALGRPVMVCEAPSGAVEAEFVMAEIYRLCADEGVDYGDIAVMYRTHHQAGEIEQALVAQGIPCRVTSGATFFERAEVQDVLAYLRVVENPADEMAFTRALGAPPRGVGAVSLDQLRAVALRDDTSLMDVARRAVGGTDLQMTFRADITEGLTGFVRLVSEAVEIAAHMPVSAVLRHIVAKSGYEARLTAANELDRIDHVHELIDTSTRYDDIAGPESSRAFLDETALVRDAVEGRELAPNTVSLMTLHSAKGLEFPVVFMVGMEEGLLPHQRSVSEDARMEEERRLCYVGMTRAQERLYLTWARQRRDYRGSRSTVRSRFLDAVPSEYIVSISS